jgi:hypothetical protein
MALATSIKCSKDGNPMTFIYESEKLEKGHVRVILYYKCPVCGSRKDLEELRIERSGENIVITRRVYSGSSDQGT